MWELTSTSSRTPDLLSSLRKRYLNIIRLDGIEDADVSLLSEQEPINSDLLRGRLTEEEARPVLEAYLQVANELKLPMALESLTVQSNLPRQHPLYFGRK